MRILTVSHFFEAHGGGIERVCGQLTRRFALVGADSAWAASDGDALPEGEVRAVPLACFNPTEKLTGLPMPIPGLRAIRGLAREVRDCDAVIVHDALYVTSLLAVVLAKVHRKRVVLVQHIAGIPFSSPILRGLMSVANRLVTRPMLRAADERVFISDTVRSELMGAGRRQHSVLVFNGVDHRIFHPGRDQATDAEPTSASPTRVGPRRILFVGRYVEKKGLAVLRELAALRPDLTFLLAGSGPIQPADWGLANVHDVGPQSPNALADLYRSADLFILPSVGEGYPLVIQEAMACGLPVICGEPANHADPDAAHWLRGVAIDLGDPQNSARRCAAAIDGLAPTVDERTEMARYARQNYDWEAMARRVLALAAGERFDGAQVQVGDRS